MISFKVSFVPLLDALLMAKIATISPFKRSKLLNKFFNKVRNLSLSMYIRCIIFKIVKSIKSDKLDRLEMTQ